MNHLEKEMIIILSELKSSHNVISVKAEFESEGSRMEEMMRLKDVVTSVGLPITLKIGGVEAITDIYNGLLIGVKGIVAPMAETPFAVSKFLSAIETFVADDNREDIDFGINLETITAFKYVDNILSLSNIRLLKYVTVGRSDLTASMGLSREDIEGETVFDISQSLLKKLKEKGFQTTLGGTITANSVSFLKRLYDENLIDKFETRKVVFSSEEVKSRDIRVGIDLALKFELLWLKSKRRYYSRIKVEDEQRISMLEKRLGNTP